MTQEPATHSASTWANRVVLEIVGKQLKKLQKGKRALVMKDKKLYELKPIEIPKVFTADGKPISKATLKRMLRRM